MDHRRRMVRRFRDSSSARSPTSSSSRINDNDDDVDDVLSVRSLYRFHPLRIGSSRPMPPPVVIDEFGEDDVLVENYYSGDDLATADDAADNRHARSSGLTGNATGVVDDEAAGRFVFEEMTSPGPNEMSSSIATTTTTSMEMNEIEGDPSSDVSRPPNNDRAMTTATEERVIVPPIAANASTYHDRRYALCITPSFMEPAKVRAMTTISGTHVDDDGGAERASLPAEASSGNSGTTQLESLSRQLEHLVLTIYRLNSGIEFNVNSPKQVARVLFGEDNDSNIGDTSTAKDALEAMASAGNEMA
jgi:hypothetical protein